MKENSILENAIELMGKKKGPQPIRKFLRELSEICGLDFDDAELMMSIYTDITTSALFVYCGDNEETGDVDMWDLKSRHPLSLYEKDGSYFVSATEKQQSKEEQKNKKKLEKEKKAKAEEAAEEVAATKATTSKILEEDEDDEDIVTPNIDEYDDDYEESLSEEEYEEYMDDYEDFMDD